jgi:leucyl aminopeptidase
MARFALPSRPSHLIVFLQSQPYILFMKFLLSDKKSTDLTANVLVIPVWENGLDVASQVKIDNEEVRKLIAETAKQEKFNGEVEKSLFLPAFHWLSYQRLLLIGLGKKKDLDPERVRRFGAWAVKNAERVSGTKIVFDLLYFLPLESDRILHALVEGIELGTYKFLKYKSPEQLMKVQTAEIEEVVIAGVERKLHNQLEKMIAIGQMYANATKFARDLINEPAMIMTPKRLFEVAQEIVQSNPGISMEYFDREAAEKKGMNAFLSIASGSSAEPYFVHLTYKPKTKQKIPKIALVGKGVTFDSGGLSLKPGDAMIDMKIDMSGAANVLAVFHAISVLAPKVEVHGLFTACENMPSGSAVKPGDIVTAMNGKTIEILNTDAEGRVCLADSLSYAVTLKPDAIIDFATLTGACMVSLGEEIAGAFTNDQKLYKAFSEAGHEEGEGYWELPLVEDYKKKIESQIADIKNVGDNRWAGAITAALFLREFVNGIPWIHLDIAGPSGVWTQFNVVPYISRGGTGFGVRSFLNYLAKNF